MIQLKEIFKSYGSGKNTYQALRGISLNFRDHEFAAILGPSGSGKTTLLNVIGGLDHYDEGDLIIDRISTKDYSERDWDSYRNHSIGFIFQNYHLIPHQSVLSNVELALTIAGISPEERRERAAQALEMVGLEGQMDKLPAQLSGGQMQRVAIARALVNNPRIILADEPTGALDSKTSIQVMDLIREVAKDHLVIMVTHNDQLAREYATRIITLKDGEITDDSNPFEPEEEPTELVSDNMGHSSMQLSTEVSLSFHNLLSKWKRTLLTAFAGSIGIIGIALILSLSTGVNHFIKTQERNLAYSYPLYVQTLSLDLTNSLNDLELINLDTGGDRVGVISLVDRLSSMLGTNDLSSLKRYLDEKEEEISEYARIEYQYAVTPQIYLERGDELRCVCPDSTLDASGIPISSLNTSLLSSSSVNMAMFTCMPENEELYQDNYDVKAGRWPVNEEECVLVLTGDGKIVDYLLYVMGIRDPAELDEKIQQVLQGEFRGTEYTEEEDFAYTDFLGISFKAISSCEFYAQNAGLGVWLDNRNQEDYVREKVAEKGLPIKIVGVVQPKNLFGSGALPVGINYHHSLLDRMIDIAAESGVVKAQMADPEINVLTGRPFTEPGKLSELDLASMVSLDVDALLHAVSFDENELLSSFLEGAGLKGNASFLQDMGLLELVSPEEMRAYIKGVIGDYLDFLKEEGYLDYTKYVQAVNAYLTSAAFRDAFFDRARELGDGELSPEAVLNEAEALTEDMLGGLEQYLEERGLTSAPVSGTTLMEYLGSTRFWDFTQSFRVPDGEGESSGERLFERIRKRLDTVLTDEVIAKGIRAVLRRASELITVDQSALIDAFSLKIDAAALSEMILSMTNLSDVSCLGNLRKMGYEDKDNPSGIQIYTTDYKAKDTIIQMLDQYNREMEMAGKPEATVTYTDALGTVTDVVTQVVNIITTILIAAVTISLIVASIMIGVITYISVLERRKEIGILRAMGASRGNISQIFRAETFLTGLLSGTMGIGLSYLLLIPLNGFVHARTQLNEISAFLPAHQALLLILIGAALTTLGGLLPAHGASKCDPVEALRSE